MRITPQLAFAIRLFERAGDLPKCALLLAIATAPIVGLVWIHEQWGMIVASIAGAAVLVFIFRLFGTFERDEKPAETLQDIPQRNGLD